MFTKVALENFKGIRERVEIELRPITLLFGGNSAGKSTILHALHYAHEVLERHNLHPDRTLKGGEFVDLGGFENLVHGHDLNRAVGFEITFEASPDELPEYLPPPPHYDEHADPLEPLLENFTELTVGCTIEWSHRSEAPFVSGYQVGIDGQTIGGITSESGRTGRTLTVVLNHPCLKSREATELSDWFNFSAIEHVHQFESGLGFLAVWLHHIGLVPSMRLASTDDLEAFSCEIGGLTDARPIWGESLAYETKSWREIDADVGEEAFRWEAWIQEAITRLIVGPGELLRERLEQFRYLGPIRTVPPRDSRPPRFPDESRWSTGLAAWDRLKGSDDRLTGAVSSWLGDEDRLNAGYHVEKRQYKEIDLADPFVVQLMTGRAFDEAEEGARLPLEDAPTHERIVITPVTNDLVLAPQDVGIGISQVVPVVVIALDGTGRLILIEQPELHLHPRLEADLGDLFIETAIREDGQQYILETHSEHLILRLLRRIREAGDEQAPVREFDLDPDDVAVVYVENGERGTTVLRLRIDIDGEFVDRWPEGFFAERARELF